MSESKVSYVYVWCVESCNTQTAKEELPIQNISVCEACIL